MAEPLGDARPFLFFSVDVADSSAYKIRYPDRWSSDFKAFFESFPDGPNGLGAACQQLKLARHEDVPVSLFRPSNWKVAGDEILFFVDLRDAHTRLQPPNALVLRDLVLAYTAVFRKAIIAHNRDAVERLKKEEPAFKAKGTAWFADVLNEADSSTTYPNVQLQFRHPAGPETPGPDFLGPQIDIGFRIAKHSSPNRFVVSVEYAILLLRDNYLTLADEGIRLYYEGRQPIKGILEHINYPVVWIDMDDRFEHAESELLRSERKQTADPVALMRFLEEYIKETRILLRYPEPQ